MIWSVLPYVSDSAFHPGPSRCVVPDTDRLCGVPGAANIPPYAVGPALIAVGALMMMNIVRIPWDQSAVMLPCFVTIITIPLTFSIAYGTSRAASICHAVYLLLSSMCARVSVSVWL